MYVCMYARMIIIKPCDKYIINTLNYLCLQYVSMCWHNHSLISYITHQAFHMVNYARLMKFLVSW